MGLKGIGRFMMGVAIGAVIALIVARKTVGEGREVFNLQRGPTMLAMVIGALGGGLTLSLAGQELEGSGDRGEHHGAGAGLRRAGDRHQRGQRTVTN
jgi:hypothetical protein